MTDHSAIIAAAKRYADKAGLSLATLGLRVANNGRLIERMERRIGILDGDAGRLEAFMKANPVVEPDASCLPGPCGAAGDVTQGEVAE